MHAEMLPCCWSTEATLGTVTGLFGVGKFIFSGGEGVLFIVGLV